MNQQAQPPARKQPYQMPQLQRLGQWQQLTQARGSRPRPGNGRDN